jgi:hypothetical protein
MWNIGTTISEYSAEIVSGDQKKEYAENTMRIFESSRKNIDTLQTYFIQKGSEADLVEYLESRAHTYGLSVITNSITLTQSTELVDSNMEYVDIKLTVSGSWSRVSSFSHSLETLPYFSSLQSFAFIHSDEIVSDKMTGPGWNGVFTIRFLKKK